MKKINIKINGKKVKCPSDKTILEIARENNIFIPTLCHHPDLSVKANCRVCVVEVRRQGQNWRQAKLLTSCSTKAEEGMEIKINSERVKRSRNLNIELIFAEHIEKCPSCVWNINCPLLKLAEKYKIEITRFPDRKGKRKVYKFANAVEIDGTQCIDCRNCLEVCSLVQNINYLQLKGKGASQEVVPTKNKDIDCIYCGQCALHCPVGAAQEQTQWEEVEKVIANKKKIVVAQFAPALRVSIGEEFKLPYGKIVTGQLVAGLKELGFDYVFDVNFGADITTIVEAEELLERLKSRSRFLSAGGKKSMARQTEAKMPMFTSCCPAWVKYVEFYHPELIPHLTTARSPHIHSGGAIKTYWADRMGINPKNIIVVSVMPCTAKKFESSRKELKIRGLFPVDYVITTREFAYLLKKNRIDFPNLKPKKSDDPLGRYSGAAAIYGGSGGVMESALRTALFLAQESKKNKIFKTKIEFKPVRGLDDVKEAEISIKGKKIRIAVVNGIGNIEPVLDNLNKYDYVEVMACPGGCIGGGGQPIPTTPEIRKKRIKALYKIDKGKKIRKAHENKAVLEFLEWLKSKGKLEHQVLHTIYKNRK